MPKNKKQVLSTMTSLAEQLIRNSALHPHHKINVSVMFFQQETATETFYSNHFMSEFGAVVEMNTAMGHLGLSEKTKGLIRGLIDKELQDKAAKEKPKEKVDEAV